ncbi:MAG: MFS transporter [Paracoccaceae bacterium]
MSILQDLHLSRRPLMAFVAVGIAWGSLAAVVPPLKAQIGASDALYGLLMLGATCGAVMAMWLGPLAVRLFGTRAMILGTCGVALGFALVPHAPNPVLYACAMFVAACGSGVADVLANAEISESEARTGRALMNLNHAMFSFSFAIAATLTGVARQAGVPPTGVMACVALACLGLAALMRGSGDSAPEEDTSTPSSRLPLGLVSLGGIVVLFAFLVEAATEGWSALHLERTLGGVPAQGALGPALFALMMGVGRFSGHLVASRISELWLMGLASALSAIGFLCVGAAPTLLVAYIGFAMAGLGISVVGPLALGLVGRTVRPNLRLTAISRVAATGYAAFFFGPPLMGGLAQMFGLRVSFVVVALLLFGAALVLVPALGRAISREVSARDALHAGKS